VFWGKRRRKTEVHVQNTVRFVGEQDGEAERLLKNALIAELSVMPEVKRAYLARVQYPDGVYVALCLDAPDDQLLVQRIGSCFAKIFAQQEHLDILFLRPDQQVELERVCAAFHRCE
jgi:hypothetical protein